MKLRVISALQLLCAKHLRELLSLDNTNNYVGWQTASLLHQPSLKLKTNFILSALYVGDTRKGSSTDTDVLNRGSMRWFLRCVCVCAQSNRVSDSRRHNLNMRSLSAHWAHAFASPSLNIFVRVVVCFCKKPVSWDVKCALTYLESSIHLRCAMMSHTWDIVYWTECGATRQPRLKKPE